MLQLSALRLPPQNFQKAGVSLAFLGAECIRLLRDRVESGDAGVTDETISAVATLAGIEVCLLSPEKRMKKQRKTDEATA